MLSTLTVSKHYPQGSWSWWFDDFTYEELYIEYDKYDNIVIVKYVFV